MSQKTEDSLAPPTPSSRGRRSAAMRARASALNSTRLLVRRVQKGNANAVALVFPDNTIGIVDWGTDDPTSIRSLLDEVAPPSMRFVLATHAHADHTLGLRNVLAECHSRGIDIDCLVYPSPGGLNKSRPSPLWRALLFAYEHRITQVEAVIHQFPNMRPGHPLPLAKSANWEVAVLAPPSAVNARENVRSQTQGRSPGNATSIVLLFRYTQGHDHKGRALLPGDATPSILNFARDHAKRHPEYHVHNDAILAPHHGSDHNWPSWLTAYVHGTVVVSSASDRPSHPGLGFLQTVARSCRRGSDSLLYCTSYNGQCRAAFAQSSRDPALLAAGSPCFGDVEIALEPTGSRVVSHDPDGPRRRAFGYCTHVPTALPVNRP